MQVLVSDLVFNYQRSGNGRSILLVHGWANSLSGFYDLQRSLSKSYDVVSVDLPGFGQSSHPPKAWGIDDYAKSLSSFIDKLDLKTYAVIGHSNGGGILINGLANNLISADKLVLLSSAGIRDKEKAKKQSLKIIAKSGKVLTSVLPGSVKNNIKRKFYNQIGSEMFISPDMEGTFRLVINQDVQADAIKIKIPTLLIYGKGDVSTPIEYGQILHDKIKNSQFEILDNAEHFVHIDQPYQVEKLIKDFLK